MHPRPAASNLKGKSATLSPWFSGKIIIGLLTILFLSSTCPAFATEIPNYYPTPAVNEFNFSSFSANLSALPPGPVKISGSNFVDSKGNRIFLSGVNYEGHTDRDWAMWKDEHFDPALISQDLSLAAAGGYNAVRIFVQTPLRDDILNGKWNKLDKVVEIAGQLNLKLLITLADYDELNLAQLNRVDSLIAGHLAGSPVILGYDLKNEPQFYDLAGGKYPDNQRPALLSDSFIQTYGERITQKDSDSWRLTPAGQVAVPETLDSRTAYYYTNAYKVFLDFLDEGSKWVVSQPRTANFMDWLAAPDTNYWKPFVEALNSTLNSWIGARLAPIKTQDPDRPTTIGFNHPYFAYLKANQALSFVSLHRFAAEGAASIYTTLNMLDQLRTRHANHPVVLEEFGYTNSHGLSKEVPLNLTANYEDAVWLFLYSRSFAGGFKWMLTSFPTGANQEENNFGLLDDQGQPKPAYYTASNIHKYIAANPLPTGDFVLLESPEGKSVNYMWAAGDVIFSNLKDYTNNRIDIHLQEPIGWQVQWESSPSRINLRGYGKGRIILDLAKFFPAWNRNFAPVLNLENGQEKGMDRTGSLVSFPLDPPLGFSLNVPIVPQAFQKTQPIGGPHSIYFKETGHNLSNIFWNYWEKHGGLGLYGYPISEEFQEGNFTVQYFERNRFEYHPENTGTPYEVLMGLLGNNLTAGRKEKGDPSFQALEPATGGAEKDFYRETGHSLGGPFRQYWQKYGGLFQFGFPISEEFNEVNPADGKTYTVQYFERARFEYHPEFKGSPNEVLLGLLGVQSAKNKGWVF